MTGPRHQMLEGIGRVSTEHLFALGNGPAPEVGPNVNGGLDHNRGDSANSLCEATLNSVMTIAQIEAMLDTAVAKARGNLFSTARLLGVRPGRRSRIVSSDCAKGRSRIRKR